MTVAAVHHSCVVYYMHNLDVIMDLPTGVLKSLQLYCIIIILPEVFISPSLAPTLYDLQTRHTNAHAPSVGQVRDSMITAHDTRRHRMYASLIYLHEEERAGTLAVVPCADIERTHSLTHLTTNSSTSPSSPWVYFHTESVCEFVLF